MFDRLMNRDSASTTAPTTAPTVVHIQDDKEVLILENPNISGLPAELSQMLADAGWVVSGRTPKPKGTAGRAIITAPRLSVIYQYGGKTVMGYIRLPRKLTNQLGWGARDKIIPIQNPRYPNKILMVKSGNNQGYNLNIYKGSSSESAGFIKFLWMLNNPVIHATKSFVECTTEIKDNNLLCLEFDINDVKTEADAAGAGVWA